MLNWFMDNTARHIIILLFKCYSSNILYWLQAEMWEKHFAIKSHRDYWEMESGESNVQCTKD